MTIATFPMSNVNTKFATKLPDRVTRMLAEQKVPWGPVGYVTYKRTYSRHLDLNDRSSPKEEYWQTITRCINGILHIGGAFTLKELEVLAEYLIKLKCNFSGRSLWQLGTPTVDRLGGDSLQACWHVRVNEPIHPFAFTFEELMLGGGVGFSIMPEDVYEIPPIKYNIDVNRVDTYDCDFIVPDNRQGWVELLRRILDGFFNTGKSLNYNPDCVRAKGQPITSFGGEASGSEDLVEGMSIIARLLKSRVGQKLRPVDALDIQNILGMIVVSGNVRRSAQIAKGSGRDRDFLLAKYWGNGQIVPRWRQHSNNTIETTDLKDVLPEFWYGYETDEHGNSNGEPYGLYNPDLAANVGRLADGRREGFNSKVKGPNPCVPGDTWVHTSEGPRQVWDLVNRPFQAIVDGKSYSSKGFWSTGQKEVFRVTTDRGFTFDCTEEHKIIRGDGKKRTLKELFIGDSIVLHNHRGVEPWTGEGTYDQGWLLGSLTGNGHFTDDFASLGFWDTGRFEERDYAASLLQGRTRSEQETGDVCTRVNSKWLADLAAKYGVVETKVLDHRIEMKSHAFYRGFLRGWMDADGSPQGDATKGISNRLTSSILGNLEIAQRMFARLGIISKVYKERRQAGYRELPNGQGGYATYWCQAQHELVISRDNLTLFESLIGHKNPQKRTKLRRLVGSLTKVYREKFKANIVSIDSIGVKEVYDCTVEKVHVFDANGVKVSNCGEQLLESNEACNLGELYMPNLIDGSEFHVAAELMHKCLKTISCLPFLYDRTNEVVKRNHRVGLGVTGVMAAHHLRKPAMFDSVYKHIVQADKGYSALLGVGPSISDTTVKPSGTLSKLPIGITPGGNPGYSLYSKLLITFASDSPMLPVLKRKGYPMEPKINLDGSRDFNATMVGFPNRYPDGTPTESITAIEQLENVVMLQRWWSDSSVSATVQYRPEEFSGIKDWLFKNYSTCLKTISFCRHSGHGFVQPPNTALTLEEWERFASSVQPIGDGDFAFGADQDDTDIGGECLGGSCGVK